MEYLTDVVICGRANPCEAGILKQADVVFRRGSSGVIASQQIALRAAEKADAA